jgi:hypothetical protein
MEKTIHFGVIKCVVTYFLSILVYSIWEIVENGMHFEKEMELTISYNRF